MTDLKWHPIAAMFPMLADDELEALADDIRENGLKESVTLFEGMVLDGRNRAAACRIAGIEPTLVTFEGTKLEALAHAWSLNRRRRQLDSSQCAIAEARRAKLSQEYAGEVDRLKTEAADRMKSGKKNPTEIVPEGLAAAGEVREQRAKAAGTNARYIDAADRIEAERPDLGDRILNGEMTIPAAQREMDPSTPSKAATKKKVQEIDAVVEVREAVERLLKKGSKGLAADTLRTMAAEIEGRVDRPAAVVADEIVSKIVFEVGQLLTDMPDLSESKLTKTLSRLAGLELSKEIPFEVRHRICRIVSICGEAIGAHVPVEVGR